MIRWQHWLPKVPISKNVIMRRAKGKRSGKYNRSMLAADRDEWRLLLQSLKNSFHGTDLWWEQSEEEPEPVAIHVKVAHWYPRDAFNPHIAGLIDALHRRKQRINTREKNPALFQYWQGVGVLVDDGPRYAPLSLTSWMKVPKGREGTLVRIRDFSDYGGIDDDMERAMEENKVTVLGRQQRRPF